MFSGKGRNRWHQNGIAQLATVLFNMFFLLYLTGAQASQSQFSLHTLTPSLSPTFFRSSHGKEAESGVDLTGATKINLSFVPDKMEFGLRQSFQTIVSAFLSAHLGHMEEPIHNLETFVYVQDIVDDDGESPSSIGLSTLEVTLEIYGQSAAVPGKIVKAEEMNVKFGQLCADTFNLHADKFVELLNSVGNEIDKNYFSFVESLEAFAPVQVAGTTAVQMSYVTGSMEFEAQKYFQAVVTRFLLSFLGQSEQPFSDIEVFVSLQEPIKDEDKIPTDPSLFPILVSIDITGQFYPSKGKIKRAEDLNLGQICSDIFNTYEETLIEQLRRIEVDTGFDYFSSIEAAVASTEEQSSTNVNLGSVRDGPRAMVFFGIGSAFGIALLLILVVAFFAWDRTVMRKESGGSRGSRTLAVDSSGDTEENTPADYFDHLKLDVSRESNQDSSSVAVHSRSDNNVTIVYQGKNSSAIDYADDWAGSAATEHSSATAEGSLKPESLTGMVSDESTSKESRELQLLTSIKLSACSPPRKQEARTTPNQQLRSLVDTMAEESTTESEESNSIVDNKFSGGITGTSSIISDSFQSTGIRSVFSARSMYDGGAPVEVVQKEVMAPPGKLGIVVDTSVNGPIVVHVKAASPLVTLVNEGDIIVAINDADTRALTADAISSLMVKSEHIQRKISLISGINAPPILSMSYTGSTSGD